MVLDTLENAERYTKSFPGLAEAARFAAGAAGLAVGRYELSDGAFGLVQAYETRDPADISWEAHRAYADVQIILEGREIIGWARRMEDAGAYDSAKDAQLAPKASGITALSMVPGLFVLFLPGEAHRPCARVTSAESVKKLVVKLPMAR
jgi:uncharacterized protein, YhcH/YjgK/YiaL family